MTHKRQHYFSSEVVYGCKSKEAPFLVFISKPGLVAIPPEDVNAAQSCREARGETDRGRTRSGRPAGVCRQQQGARRAGGAGGLTLS